MLCMKRLYLGTVPLEALHAVMCCPRLGPSAHLGSLLMFHVGSTSLLARLSCSDFKAKAEKRRGYNRHYALKGRARKDHFRQATVDDRAELTPSRAACKQKQ